MECPTHDHSPHTSRNKREEAPDNATHSYSYRQNRRETQPLPEKVRQQLKTLRLQYKDKIIKTFTFESRDSAAFDYEVYPDEYHEKELEILCGDMDPEQAVDYLLSFDVLNLALLKRLDTVRAYQYIRTIGHRPESREYTERAIVENPGTAIELEARYYLADVLIPWHKDCFTERAQVYREILEIEPNSINALVSLASVLVLDDKPKEAIPYLKQVNRLNPKAGFLTLGEAFEKLGDVKAAWVCYKKALANDHPQSWQVRLHIDAIEAGKPLYKPIPPKSKVLYLRFLSICRKFYDFFDKSKRSQQIRNKNLNIFTIFLI